MAVGLLRPAAGAVRVSGAEPYDNTAALTDIGFVAQDTPVVSLDPLARREFLQSLMGSGAESGTTVLLSSHILSDRERSCDFLVVLQGGRVQLSGDVNDIVVEHRQLVGPRHLPLDGPGLRIRSSAPAPRSNITE